MNIPVIILNWNGWDDTRDCLAALREARGVTDVWLVDNASVEDRGAEMKAAYPGLRIERLSENLGWAGGNNEAVKRARAEGFSHVYLLNNDTAVHPDFLSELLPLVRETNVASIGSHIVYPDGSSLFDGNYHKPGALHSGAEEAGSVKRVNGCGMLVNLAAVDACGGFDERFFCYREESEWSYRVREAGWGLLLHPRSLVTHKVAGSDVGANKHYYMLRNAFLFAERQPVLRRRWSQIQALYRIYEAARKARRAGDHETREACRQALTDGIERRFGKRSAARPAASGLARLLGSKL